MAAASLWKVQRPCADITERKLLPRSASVMAKSKKGRIPNRNHHDTHTPKAAKKGTPRNGVQKKAVTRTTGSGPKQKHHLKPTVPFEASGSILLVGEGDFSFALSLLTHHKCTNLLATCYDTEDTLYTKYPQARTNIAQLTGGHLHDSNPHPVSEDQDGSSQTEWTGISPSPSSSPISPSPSDPDSPTTATSSSKIQILHSLDARRLAVRGTPHAPLIRKQAPFNKIVFQFPHVGGLSTDVNRQVRSNQELLVEFFKSAVPLLAVEAKTSKSRPEKNEFYGSGDGEEDGHGEEERPKTTGPGQILVTLFEAEPYTLWNIRDLARHAGLKVVTSFRFPWGEYPGYRHARTVGEIEGKEREEGKRAGKWRGEEREARMYVFEKKEVEVEKGNIAGTGANEVELGERKAHKKKRRRGEDSESENEDH